MMEKIEIQVEELQEESDEESTSSMVRRLKTWLFK